MSLNTLFVSGPPEAGKTTMARMIAEHVIESTPHYLRMRQAADGHTNTIVEDTGEAGSLGDGWASRYRVTYTSERVFETLPDSLRTIKAKSPRGVVLIEADADPNLRHAYPYDYRLFVMSAPADLHTVFRRPQDAAHALHRVMQDTAAFASEIFGLFDAAGLDDSVGVSHESPTRTRDQSEIVETLDIGESQIRHFLNSPLGAEIASRIQLQPEYHGLVESDVVVINTAVGHNGDELDSCVKRLEKLLGRIRHDARRHSVLYWGDIQDIKDPTHSKLVNRLRALLAL